VSAHFEIPPGTPDRQCSSCLRKVFWVKTKAGKPCPVDPDGTNHFITCPTAARHRKASPGRRAAARERQGAEILGTKRVVRRSRYESAPDNLPVLLKCGETIQPESKTREQLPKWLVDAIAQCRRYAPTAIPVVYISGLGGEPLALLPLRDFARLVGITEPRSGAQLTLGAPDT
jgi:hypothetical protein